MDSGNDTGELMVSIRCATYNHEPYIRQCLEGFVMQKTNFRFEAIVHDDASTDGTANIIREYAEKYPDLIKPIYETENQYSKHDGSLQKIMANACVGKYIALCEGDDYWIDPLKLQKQVDFLEGHPEYSMCFHNAILHYEENALTNMRKNKRKQDYLFSHIKNKDYTGLQITDRFIVPTASVLFRKEILYSTVYLNALKNENFLFGDLRIWLSCAKYGKIRGFSDVMSVYRHHKDGVSLITSTFDINKIIRHYLTFPVLFGTEYKNRSIDLIARKGVQRLVHSKFEDWYCIKTAMRYSFIVTVISIARYAFILAYRYLQRKFNCFKCTHTQR